VVDAIDPPATVDGKHVATLAIGVVDGGIEHGHWSQPGIVAQDHRDHVDLGIDIDPLLDGTLAERPLAHDRGWHDPPTAGLGHEVRRHLAVGERAVGEVVERPFAQDRLVDRLDDDRWLGIRTGECQPAEHRVVGRCEQATDDLELTIGEDAERDRRVGREHRSRAPGG
jgi:hypothetical protein